MTCPNCGRVNEEGTNFCVECGTKLENQMQSAADEILQPAKTIENEDSQPEPAEVETAPAEPAPAKVEPTPAYDRLEEVMKDSKPKTKKKAASSVIAKFDMGLVKKIGVAAIILIAIIILISAVRSCSSGGKFDAEKLPVIYESVDDVMYLNVGQQKSKTLVKDDYIGNGENALISADGKYLFFCKNFDGGEFDLYSRDLSKKSPDANVRVAKNITDYMILPDGSTVIYIQDNDIYKCGRNGKKPLKLAKDFGDDEFDDDARFDINDDFTAIIYENDEGELFYSKGVDKLHNKICKEDEYAYAYLGDSGKKIVVVEYEIDDETYEVLYTVSHCGTGKNDKPEKVESDMTDFWFADEKFNSMYYIKNGKLYFKEGTKDSKEIEGFDGDAMRVSTVYDDDENKHFYLITEIENDDEEEYNLYYVNGKTAKLVIEDVGTGSYYGEKVIEVSYYDYDKNREIENHYVRVEYDKFVEIDVPKEDGKTVKYYYTDNNFYTIENYKSEKGTGDLVKYEITKKGINFDKGVTIAEDVLSINTSYADFFDKETIIIKHDTEEYSVYSGGKKAVEIDEDVHNFLWFEKDGTMILAVDRSNKNYTYTLAKFNGKKLVEIADSVDEAVILGEKSIYYIDKSDDLYFNKGKKSDKDVLIGRDIYDIINPLDLVVVEDGTKADFAVPYLYFD